MMSVTNELIPVLKKQFGKAAGEAPATLGDWLYARGRASEALLYAILFMPELQLIQDSILLGWNLPDESAKRRFVDALAEGKQSRQQLETSFNFIEVGYLFDAPGRDTEDEEDEILAKLIKNAWEGWLKVSYPDRRFKVEVLSPEETGSTVGVHFFEER